MQALVLFLGEVIKCKNGIFVWPNGVIKNSDFMIVVEGKVFRFTTASRLRINCFIKYSGLDGDIMKMKNEYIGRQELEWVFFYERKVRRIKKLTNKFSILD